MQTIQTVKGDTSQTSAIQQGTTIQQSGLPQGATIVKLLNPGTGNRQLWFHNSIFIQAPH